MYSFAILLSEKVLVTIAFDLSAKASGTLFSASSIETFKSA